MCCTFTIKRHGEDRSYDVIAADEGLVNGVFVSRFSIGDLMLLSIYHGPASDGGARMARDFDTLRHHGFDPDTAGEPVPIACLIAHGHINTSSADVIGGAKS